MTTASLKDLERDAIALMRGIQTLCADDPLRVKLLNDLRQVRLNQQLVRIQFSIRPGQGEITL
jgi:hypothetical protein